MWGATTEQDRVPKETLRRCDAPHSDRNLVDCITFTHILLACVVLVLFFLKVFGWFLFCVCGLVVSWNCLRVVFWARRAGRELHILPLVGWLRGSYLLV